MAVNIPEPTELLSVPGVRLASFRAEVKAGATEPDLVVMDLAPGTSVAGVFTQSHFAAPPVLLCRERLSAAESSTPIRRLVINSGNANAATGEQGRAFAERICAAVHPADASAVLPFSTGVIGEQLPVDRMIAALAGVDGVLDDDGWLAAARAIMTTDTVPKVLSETIDLHGTPITITGMAKGSGMIEPNMATMLAYIACDACVEAAVLQRACQRIADRSFNCVTVDGDTSTNDAFLLLATGQAGHDPIDSDEHELLPILEAGLTSVAVELAQRIARDGEGATHFVTVNVSGASSDDDCHVVAKALANSPLLKTAIFAGDPNWGRLCMAIGKAPVALDPAAVSVFLESAAGRCCVARDGQGASDYVEARATRIMAEPELTIDVQLGERPTAARVWTCDFSYDYVKINAEYRT